MIWDLLIAPFAEFGFMRRALLGCIAVAIGATPVGVFLMLRHMSLTGDAMAHAILPGAAIGYLISGLSLGAMTLGGLIAGMVVALASGFVARVTALREDASLAAFYLISLALGVLIVSTRGSNVDLMHVLFGTVLALDDAALILLCSFASISVLSLALLFRPLVLECADPQFLRSVSKLSAVTHFAFLTLVVLNLVGGFHALGTLMAVGMMILPAAAARFWSSGIGGLIAVSAVVAILSSLIGLLLSFHYGLPSGPAIILVAGVGYGMSVFFGPVGGLIVQSLPGRNFET
ncbi:MAG: metal ABC transporter permease [Pseudomonadota bacterium]